MKFKDGTLYKISKNDFVSKKKAINRWTKSIEMLKHKKGQINQEETS